MSLSMLQYIPYTIKFGDECMELISQKSTTGLMNRLTPKPKLKPIIYVSFCDKLQIKTYKQIKYIY